MVTKVADSDYEIIVKDKTLYVGGKINIQVKGDATVNVDGKTNITGKGNMTVKSNGNIKINASKIDLN